MTKEPTLNTIQVAQILDCNSETVRRAVRSGKIRPLAQRTQKNGWLFSSSEIVCLPKPSTYWTASKTALEMQSSGLFPAELNLKACTQRLWRITKEKELPGIQAKLSNFWLYEPDAVKQYISKKLKQKKQ